MLSVNDFFSGCGGLSQGFKEAGFKIQVAVDKEEAFLKTFSHNFKDSETQSGKVAHVGWNLKTTGSGGRAGRIQFETLVALTNSQDA